MTHDRMTVLTNVMSSERSQSIPAVGSHLHREHRQAKVAYRDYPGGGWGVTRRGNGEGGFQDTDNELFGNLGANDLDLFILQKCNRLYTLTLYALFYMFQL